MVRRKAVEPAAVNPDSVPTPDLRTWERAPRWLAQVEAPRAQAADVAPVGARPCGGSVHAWRRVPFRPTLERAQRGLTELRAWSFRPLKEPSSPR